MDIAVGLGAILIRLADGSVKAWGSVTYLDERVGEVLDALSATGLESDTLVVFTADHGELLGERRRRTVIGGAIAKN